MRNGCITATLSDCLASVFVTISPACALAHCLLLSLLPSSPGTLPLLPVSPTGRFLIQESGMLHLAYTHLFTGPIPLSASVTDPVDGFSCV